jgi:hypothetical protein
MTITLFQQTRNVDDEITALNDTDKSRFLIDGVIGAPAPRQNPRPGAVDITGEQNAQIVWRTRADLSLQCLQPDFGIASEPPSFLSHTSVNPTSHLPQKLSHRPSARLPLSIHANPELTLRSWRKNLRPKINWKELQSRPFAENLGNNFHARFSFLRHFRVFYPGS